MISSLSNPKVKELAKLSIKKYRDESNTFIVEGPHLVIEAFKKGLVIEAFSLDETYTQVSRDVMKKICDTKTEVSVCALCKKPNNTKIGNKILMLDRIQDPGNLGTLIRSALSFGFDTIVLDDCVDYTSAKVIRSTQGALFNVSIIVSSINEFINDIKEKGYTIYGTALENGINLKDVKKSNKLAIILGNEGSGVRKELLDITDYNIFIEMSNMESLNVGVAGSIIMYEVSLWE